MELTVVQELIQTLGPIGGIAVVLGWWFMTQREKRNGTADKSAQQKARDTIITMGSDVKHMKEDITEIKEDGKEQAKALLDHVTQHPAHRS